MIVKKGDRARSSGVLNKKYITASVLKSVIATGTVLTNVVCSSNDEKEHMKKKVY